jgi:hypothetical protein
MDDQAHQPSNTTEQSNPALEGLLKKEDWMATNDRPAVEIVHVLNIKEKLLEEQAREEALETFYASLAPSEDTAPKELQALAGYCSRRRFASRDRVRPLHRRREARGDRTRGRRERGRRPRWGRGGSRRAGRRSDHDEPAPG